MRRPRVLAAVVLVLTAWLGAQERTSERCVDIDSSGRLRRGEPFRASIGHGLELRLNADSGSWWIVVGPSGQPEDYLSLVSPPLQTAPHLAIGAAYGSSARESAQMTPRRFRFVLTRAEYERARAMIRTAGTDPSSTLTAADLERMGRGTLLLDITDFELTPDGETLAWIEFTGRACVPDSLPQ